MNEITELNNQLKIKNKIEVYKIAKQEGMDIKAIISKIKEMDLIE